MTNEVNELLDTAIYREIASQAQYIAGQKLTDDPGVQALLKELAEEELRHCRRLKNLKDKEVVSRAWHLKKVPDLMISDYLSGGGTLEGAGLQDTLTFAIKREHESAEFYSRMMGAMRDPNAKRLCQRLAQEELKHKLKLEILYDDLFYGED